MKFETSHNLKPQINHRVAEEMPRNQSLWDRGNTENGETSKAHPKGKFNFPLGVLCLLSALCVESGFN